MRALLPHTCTMIRLPGLPRRRLGFSLGSVALVSLALLGAAPSLAAAAGVRARFDLDDRRDLDVINTLDGFNVQPRLSIPFDGPIDVTTANSNTVFLVSLGSTLPGGQGAGEVIGINQVVWDMATATLHAESDRILDQHTRYALIVTRGVLDAAGHPVGAAAGFGRFRHELNF